MTAWSLNPDLLHFSIITLKLVFLNRNEKVAVLNPDHSPQHKYVHISAGDSEEDGFHYKNDFRSKGSGSALIFTDLETEGISQQPSSKVPNSNLMKTFV